MSHMLSRRKVSNAVSTWLESVAGGLNAQDWTLLSPWYAAYSTPDSAQLHAAVAVAFGSFTGCIVHVQIASSVQTPDKCLMQGTCWSLCAGTSPRCLR